MQKEALQQFVGHFKAPVKYAFAYGSGVFSQGTKRSARTQVDLIFGVEDARKWHQTNIAQNPGHYSGLRHLGAGAVAFVQERMGAGVYFNPFIPYNGHVVKYGVVTLNGLHDDLTNWRTLYLAGRMHKPVKTLIQNPWIQQSQEHNLLTAMAVALLLLPKEFSERDFYKKLAGVSYLGDVRMAVAENPHKVRNIVTHQFGEFRRLYMPLFSRMGLQYPTPVDMEVGPDSEGVPIIQGGDDSRLIRMLPLAFQNRFGDKNIVTRLRVTNAVRSTVKWPSATQSAKGILTAGILRSGLYTLEKLKKRWA